MKVRITEYLDIDLEAERWCCNRCGHDLGDARESYKRGCLVRERDPREIHFPIGPSKEFNFSFDPDWMRIVEFYCPGCAVMVENEYLPPGHPLTWGHPARHRQAQEEARRQVEAPRAQVRVQKEARPRPFPGETRSIDAVAACAKPANAETCPSDTSNRKQKPQGARP